MPLKLSGSTSGTVTLDTPAVAGSNTLILPAVTGNVITNQDSGTVTPTMMSQKLTLMTAQNTTAGTSIDFTSIPSWAKRITVMFNGVSTSGTSPVLVQIGSGSITATGYSGSSSILSSGVVTINLSTGFQIYFQINDAAAATRSGIMTIGLIGSNVYSCSSVLGLGNASASSITSGAVSLSGVLDRVRITTVGGTDTFDAGSINIMYEG